MSNSGTTYEYNDNSDSGYIAKYHRERSERLAEVKALIAEVLPLLNTYGQHEMETITVTEFGTFWGGILSVIGITHTFRVRGWEVGTYKQTVGSYGLWHELTQRVYILTSGKIECNHDKGPIKPEMADLNVLEMVKSGLIRYRKKYQQWSG